ncbi:ferredoxin--NADP reductase [Legionella spiritensis]|uniref:ferredoxin--NADP(+) reductase n=1 Tax=Legionella spiritensis TaxID=452 RepID=A0A0W0Z9W2_LEGSP|nr:ferredoxin--NADP reductase [Legionella spiritensis]KTD65906.1 phenol hydroxylase [Legionella spiritensis]SNV31921.1 phenol hydroxylase [Legionella spiritensis]VEG92191.1 phenol hydroxylase [Legionella spiritensis]
MQVKTFPIVLEEAFMLSPNVKHFIFKRELSPAFNYTPGQFITIHFERDNKILRRSYSIANTPQQNNRIEFAAGYVEGGPGTDLLFHLSPGDTININGPFGRLILKDDMPKRYILAATSTGITPYRSMITELKTRLERNPSLQIVILQGVQKREDLLYPEEFRALAKEHPQVTFRAHLSRENKETLQENEYTGYVQHAFAELEPNPENDVVYLCGNPGMIDDAFRALQERGFAMQQIIREKYISK